MQFLLNLFYRMQRSRNALPIQPIIIIPKNKNFFKSFIAQNYVVTFIKYDEFFFRLCNFAEKVVSQFNSFSKSLSKSSIQLPSGKSGGKNKSPMPIRMSSSTWFPKAANIRLIWWYFPSCKPTSAQVSPSSGRGAVSAGRQRLPSRREMPA